MKRKIDYIVIHCTATPQNTSVESILRYWRENLGWKSTGYHFLIDRFGQIHEILSMDKIANGVRGFNSKSIHISYIGGEKKDDRNEAQKTAMRHAIKRAQDYAAPNKPKIQGHRDFPNVKKACPQFNAIEEYSNCQ
jgi:N-acetylmuramoyl-L-alanine amidase